MATYSLNTDVLILHCHWQLHIQWEEKRECTWVFARLHHMTIWRVQFALPVKIHVCSTANLNVMSRRPVGWAEGIKLNCVKVWSQPAVFERGHFILTVWIQTLTPGNLRSSATFSWRQSHYSDCSFCPWQHLLSSLSFKSHHFINVSLEAFYCLTKKKNIYFFFPINE